jgi:hypothetical protein
LSAREAQLRATRSVGRMIQFSAAALVPQDERRPLNQRRTRSVTSKPLLRTKKSPLSPYHRWGPVGMLEAGLLPSGPTIIALQWLVHIASGMNATAYL